MKSARKPIVDVLAVCLLLTLVLQAGSFILLHSNTEDELAYIGAGADYLHAGRLDLDILEHPPLMKYLIGTALLPVSNTFPSFSEASRLGSYGFGYQFLYRHPNVKPEITLAFARLPSLILSLILALFVYLWACRWYGNWGGILALAVYCLEPNIVAHSGLATIDVGLACFLFLAAYFFVLWQEKRRNWQLIASGFLAGCAIATKIPGLIFFFWAPCLLLTGTKLKESFSIKKGGYFARILTFLLLVAFFVVILAYQVRYLPALFEMLRYRVHQMYFSTALETDPVFLHGVVRTGGWRSYFLFAFLLKTTIPFLVLLGWAFLERRDARKKIALLIPAAAYFLFCSMSSMQGGIRYLLPVYPFLCVLIGGLADIDKNRVKAAIASALVLWNACECVFIYPHYMSYFNELIGGPSHGYEWFWDSNVDWGQDYAKIGAYLKKTGSPEVIFANFFNADRDYYLGPRQDLLGDPAFTNLYFHHMNSMNPSREVLVISSALVQGVMLSDHKLFSWLLGKKPLTQIGYSTFVYDITHDAESHYLIGIVYARTERFEFALREFRKAAALAPDDPRPNMAIRKAISLQKLKNVHG